MRLSYRGYIFGRPFFGERVPQSVQNLVIRNFCERNKINFLLSKSEYAMDDAYSILNFVIDNLEEVDGLVFYSILMLPRNSKNRIQIINKVLAKGKKICFALEEICIKNKKDILRVENIFNTRLTLDYCLQNKI
tara:strand:- start:48 stop:449 length:402 start_codon:yes stop_codon:yes gene_type:complete